MKLYTDYPFISLGDRPGVEAPIREVEIERYDGNKYCLVRVGGLTGQEVKAGYIYTASGRLGTVPSILDDLVCINCGLEKDWHQDGKSKVCLRYRGGRQG